MMRPRHRYGHHGRRPGMAMWLLAFQLIQFGVDRIPPVTLASLIGQVVIYLQVKGLPIRWPGLSQVCVSARHVWFHEEWSRLVFASFFHVNEWHLYYNMVSLLWKGHNLERKLGSKYFLYMIAVFSVLINFTIVALSLAAENIMRDPSYLSSCAVGFSGVLFALKVVATHMSPPGQSRLGFLPIYVPSRWACWAELLLIQILLPNVSFLGHLAGILVGLLYVKGPLKSLMDSVIPTGPSYTYRQGTTGQGTGASRYYNQATDRGPGYTTGRGRGASDNRVRGADYTAGLSEEEQVAQAMRDSLQDAGRSEPSAPPVEQPADTDPQPPPYPPPSYQQLYPDLSQADTGQTNNMEEMRRRRLARFDR